MFFEKTSFVIIDAPESDALKSEGISLALILTKFPPMSEKLNLLLFNVHDSILNIIPFPKIILLVINELFRINPDPDRSVPFIVEYDNLFEYIAVESNSWIV
jgi:hypothetical protein